MLPGDDFIITAWLIREMEILLRQNDVIQDSIFIVMELFVYF
jgi:hypothetical protein